MTEDQIKAIAEEYARQNPPSTTDEILKREVARLNAEQVFEPFLRFLNERYCIVEREKVMELYNKMKIDHCHYEDGFSYPDWSIYHAKDRLEDLFGTSMFNQSEE